MATLPQPFVPTRPRLAVRGLIAPVAIAAAAILPFAIGSDYLFSAILVPVLILSLAGLGLNILTGYAGQLSLGSAAFMAIGAFATYNLTLRVPGLSLLPAMIGGGVIAAVFGLLFGLPSLRVKGFYLIASTLAAQFFVPWALSQYGWFTNNNASGVISAPPLTLAGFSLDSPAGRYAYTLGIVAVLTFLARNLIHSPTGRAWMAVRDMDLAAAALGISPGRTKLLAFAVSSFLLGVAGALWAFAYLGTVEPAGFDLDRSFQILFVIIIGGLGSIRGNFLGAAFITLLPVALSIAGGAIIGPALDPALLENAQKVIFGALIIFFLVAEPDGLTRLLDRALRTRSSWIGHSKSRQ
jgi:branched-chain amino acid transport system permease protein